MLLWCQRLLENRSGLEDGVIVECTAPVPVLEPGTIPRVIRRPRNPLKSGTRFTPRRRVAKGIFSAVSLVASVAWRETSRWKPTDRIFGKSVASMWLARIPRCHAPFASALSWLSAANSGWNSPEPSKVGALASRGSEQWLVVREVIIEACPPIATAFNRSWMPFRTLRCRSPFLSWRHWVSRKSLMPRPRPSWIWPARNRATMSPWRKSAAGSACDPSSFPPCRGARSGASGSRRPGTD